MELGVGILLVIGLAVFTVTPLLAPEGPSEDALPIDVTPLTDLKRRRMVVYENLQDLDFEYKAGKVSREDFRIQSRESLKRRLRIAAGEPPG